MSTEKKRTQLQSIGDLTIASLLTTQAHTTPTRVMWKDYSFGMENPKVITAFERNQMANKMGNAFLDLGLKKGDHVAWLEGDYYWFLYILFGCAKSGMVQCPTNYRFVPDEIQRQTNHSDAVVFIVGEDFIEKVESVRDKLTKVKHFIAITDKKKTPDGYLNFWDLLDNGSDKDPQERVGKIEPDDLFAMGYTAGTTGMPKGALHTHASGLAWGGLFVWGFNFTWQETTGLPAPYFHWGIIGCAVCGCLLLGTPVIAMGTYKFDPSVAWKAFAKENVTQLITPPAIIHGMFLTPGWEEMFDGSKIKHYAASGGPLPAPDIKNVLEKFPNTTFVYAYAATEAIFTGTNREMMEKNPSAENVGMPFPQIEISIRDIDDPEKELPLGEKGLIYVNGPGRSLGYYNAPEINKSITDSKGWTTVEELGYIDPETSNLHFVDRKKDMICTGAENVASIEVDEALMSHPAVFEAATIGIPHERWGEQVISYVSLKPGLEATAEDLIKFCREKIADYKVPKEIKFIDELPKNPFGKLMKRELRDPYWEGKEKDRLWGTK